MEKEAGGPDHHHALLDSLLDVSDLMVAMAEAQGDRGLVAMAEAQEGVQSLVEMAEVQEEVLDLVATAEVQEVSGTLAWERGAEEGPMGRATVTQEG